jgi:H+/Cl- antiporter ClcA/CBS domain-containing protein
MLLLCALALPIGAISAVAAKALLWLIAVITNAAFLLRWSSGPATPAASHLGPGLILVPVLGGIAVGLLARYGSAKIRGHGIPEALEAILLGRSLIEPRVALLKPLSSAIAIGTGGPFGAEGPIIVTGGAFGSVFAQLFRLTAAERKTLLVAGAAAGMAAIFATPVAAVLLAVEVLLFEWKPRSFLPVTVAALAASVLHGPLLGAAPVFPVAAHAALPPAMLGVAVAVGLVVGLASGLLTALVDACEARFHRLPVPWMWWPAIGGLAVGLGGWADPRVLGIGDDTIHRLMAGQPVGGSLAVLGALKALVWTIALSSGTSGGVLSPLLLIGGAIGTLFGVGIGAGDPGLWAMVGMAAIMGGAMRAPLAGMAFVLELTHDLNALPALLLGSSAALAVTVLLLRRSILTGKLARGGQHVSYEYSVDVFETACVGDVMDRQPPVVPAGITVAELTDRIARGDPRWARRQATVVLDDDGRLAGIITREDLRRIRATGLPATTTVGAVATADVAVAYPDEALGTAISRLLARGVGRLPVVARADPRRVVGYLGRAEILAARARLGEEEERRERGPILAPRPG